MVSPSPALDPLARQYLLQQVLLGAAIHPRYAPDLLLLTAERLEEAAAVLHHHAPLTHRDQVTACHAFASRLRAMAPQLADPPSPAYAPMRHSHEPAAPNAELSAQAEAGLENWQALPHPLSKGPGA